MSGTTCFLRDGTKFVPADKRNLDMQEVLPPGNYIIKTIPMTENLMLEQVDDFVNPSRLYGDTAATANRILQTFWDRPQSTGVLLSGEKGSGKSLLARQLSIIGATAGVPTVVVNTPRTGDNFNQLIQSISQPAIVLFDEFEKVYDEDDQPFILTLLDGVFNSKKLFVITCNDTYRIDNHMKNRPGRIFYNIEFDGLSNDFIREYCEENLTDKSHIDSFISITGAFGAFNFDMMKAVVEEMNRYGESPKDAIKLLNIKPQSDTSTYNVTLLVDGVIVNPDDVDYVTTTCDENPLVESMVEIYVPDRQDSDDDSDCINMMLGTESEPVRAPRKRKKRGHTRILITKENFVQFTPATGDMVFQYGVYTIIFSRKRNRRFDYFAAF